MLRWMQLLEAGIDHIQLSFQDARVDDADHIGGYRGGHAKKTRRSKTNQGRRTSADFEFCCPPSQCRACCRHDRAGESLGATRIEIAHTQYHGWALRNRNGLLPTRAQLEQATHWWSGPGHASRVDHHRLCGSRLLRHLAEGLHGRLGTTVYEHFTLGQSTALPCRRNADPSGPFPRYAPSPWPISGPTRPPFSISAA